MDKKRAQEKLNSLKKQGKPQEFEDDSDDFEDALDDEEEADLEEDEEEEEEQEETESPDEEEENEDIPLPPTRRGKGRPPGSKGRRGRPEGSTMPTKFEHPVEVTLKFETLDVKTIDGILRALKNERYRYENAK